MFSLFKLFFCGLNCLSFSKYTHFPVHKAVIFSSRFMLSLEMFCGVISENNVNVQLSGLSNTVHNADVVALSKVPL
jgi:hypothetical protein